MRPRHLIYSCCVAALSCSAACGDDDGGGVSATVDTGLPATDTLDSLDEEDATQACVETAQSFNKVLPESELERISCVLLALELILQESEDPLGPGHIGECKEVSQECEDGEVDGEPIVDIETNVVSEEECADAETASTFDGCDATVADYERCAGKLKAELGVRLRGITCDALKDPAKFTAMLTEIDISDSAECKALRDKCPEIALSGGDEDNAGEEEDEEEDEEEE